MAGTIPFPDDADGRVPPEKKQSDLDKLIDHIYFVAEGARTVDEIVRRLAKERKINVTKNQVEYAIMMLRRNRDYYGWMMPHVKAGPSIVKDGKKRQRSYTIVHTDKDGRLYSDPGSQASIQDGGYSMVSRTIAQTQNSAASFKACSQATRLPKRLREWYEDMAYQFSHMAREAKKGLRIIKEANGE